MFRVLIRKVKRLLENLIIKLNGPSSDPETTTRQHGNVNIMDQDATPGNSFVVLVPEKNLILQSDKMDIAIGNDVCERINILENLIESEKL